MHERRKGDEMSDNQWKKDKVINPFSGADSETFAGTRSDFKKEFGVGVNALFRKDKKRGQQVNGRMLPKELILW